MFFKHTHEQSNYLVVTEQDIEELWTRCGFLLLPLFRLGYRWITRFLGLALYAMLLMPGFLQGECKKDALFQSIHIERTSLVYSARIEANNMSFSIPFICPRKVASNIILPIEEPESLKQLMRSLLWRSVMTIFLKGWKAAYKS